MVKIKDFKKQNYEKLKKNLIQSGKCFIDSKFPTELGLDGSKTIDGTIEWKRICEISENAKFFCPENAKFSSNEEDISSSLYGMSEGVFGTSAFVTAAAALGSIKELWEATIPDWSSQDAYNFKKKTDLGFEGLGLFKFRFWRFGKWIEVLVDDTLPVKDNELICSHFSGEKRKHEFWLPLLEKAYAKLCGSYGAAAKTNLGDILVDFSSGFSEVVDLTQGGYKGAGTTDTVKEYEERVEKLKETLMRTRDDENGIICCNINSPAVESKCDGGTKSGLIRGHDYVVTGIVEVFMDSAGRKAHSNSGEKVILLRLLDPWGLREWNGPFSHSSLEWTRMEESEKQEMGLTFNHKAEFWMPYEDFLSEFNSLTLCHIINHHQILSTILNKGWADAFLVGGWTRPNHAGGSATQETFLRNPQYSFTVSHPEGTELIIQLVQKPSESSGEYLRAGFVVMRVEDNREHRIHKSKKKVVTSDYVKGRSVLWRGNLPKGRYLIVPCTFAPGQSAEFMLRIHSKVKVDLRELGSDYPLKGMAPCSFAKSRPAAVSIITVQGASGLAECENTYCIIRTGTQKLKSDVVHNSTEPQWGIQGVFWRWDLCQPIVVELWESKEKSRKRFLGCALLSGESDNNVVELKKSLVGKGKKKEEIHPGEITVLIATYDDLNSA